jgi:hypothetical protein
MAAVSSAARTGCKVKPIRVPTACYGEMARRPCLCMELQSSGDARSVMKGSAVDTDIKDGLTVYTADGEKLGTIKEIAKEGDHTYFRIAVRLRPDYWLGANWASHTEERDGDECLILEFPKELLDTYKLPQPG